jgi:hypothetical protein
MVRFVVLTVFMNIAIVWNIPPHSLYVNRRFGGNITIFKVAIRYMLVFAGLLFYSEDGGDAFLRNVGSHRSTRRYIPVDGNIQTKLCFCVSFTKLLRRERRPHRTALCIIQHRPQSDMCTSYVGLME